MDALRKWLAKRLPNKSRPPRSWVDKNWGINGTPDWGEKSWPGWKRPDPTYLLEKFAYFILALGVLSVFLPTIFFYFAVRN